MNNIYQNTWTPKFAYFTIPVVGLLAFLILLPTKISVVSIAIFTAGVGIVSYRLNNHLLTVFSAAFLSRILFIFLDSSVGILPAPPIMSSHNQRAIEVAVAWSNGEFLGVLDIFSSLMPAFMAHLLSPFYVILGHSPIAGRVGIAFVSLFIGYMTFRLARQVTDRQTSIIATSLVLFWPTIVYRSVVIQREVVITTMLLAFLWAAVQWLDSLTLPTVTVAAIATASIFVLRKENLFLIAVMVGFVSLVKSRDKPYNLAGAILLVTPFLAYFILNFGQFTGFGDNLSPDALDSFAYGRAHGDAAYLIGLHYNSWIDVFLYAPIKVMYFLYTPFPWHVRGVTELIVGLSAFALLIATAFMRRGIALIQDETYYLGLLLSYLLTGVVAYSIIEMNYGAAVRRRISFIPIILLFATIGFSNIRIKMKSHKP